jgi:2-methylcitrate dehydratase PrpD
MGGLNPTLALAAQAAGLRFDDLPADAVTVAKQCILDVIGSAIAGAASPGSAMVRESVLLDGGTGVCSLFGVPQARVTAGAAALANGTAAHALDFDDVLTAMIGHPSAPVLPAVFALAEEGGRSGRRLLEAFVAGVEVEARIGSAVAPAHYARGFHATGTVGTFGAAAAAARILDASEAAMTSALSLAGAQAAGLKSQFGTMTKPLQAGKAAANGLLAARLAVGGFTAAPDVIGCEQGFAATQADGLDVEALTAPFGRPWHLLATLFKMHASCHYTHSVFESLRSLRDRVPVSDVEAITLRVHPDLRKACDILIPETGLAGKFSMRYVAALALAVGRADPAQFTDEAVRDPVVSGLRARVDVVPDDTLHHFTCEAVLRSRDGRRYEASRHAGRPAWRSSPDEQTPALLEKFTSLTEPVLGGPRSARLAQKIMTMEEVPDVSGLLTAA